MSNKSVYRNPVLLIDDRHTALGIDDVYTGLNVYSITDVEVLVKWWNLVIKKAGARLTNKVQDKGLQEFHSAIWITLNTLLPDVMLRFEHITERELLTRLHR